VSSHRAYYRGLRYVTVTCRCGWVSMNHRSRGEAKRAHDGHVWLATSTPTSGPRTAYGVDARKGNQ
jgi:hypothetical protein